MDKAAQSSAERRIGPFTIVETIATRAFSVTYRAEQGPLGRPVWLKTLKSTVSAESPFAAELGREAMVLGRLSHESIIRLYDFSRAPGALWLVLEDVRGVWLEAVMAKGAIEVDPAVAIGLAVARALGHAHSLGIVHRGLRPSGVMVLPDGGVKLVEFASAQVVDGGGEWSRLPSLPEPLEAGETFARPDYMAPEQILGETAGARSDVWALGVLLYAMLAGVGPFAAADKREVAQRVRSASPSALPPGVPRAMDRVVMRCLAKDPEDRYEDAQQVALALEEALAERTRVPARVLVSRALSVANLGEELLAPAGSAAPVVVGRQGPEVGRAARSLAVVLALIVGGGALIELLKDSDADAVGVAQASDGVIGGRASLRVVAQPWAEVFVDGELLDTTPIGRPIWVSPGKHFVTFKHPNAPDEQRSIKVVAGQTVFLDVTMRIDRGDAGAGDGGPDAGDSP